MCFCVWMVESWRGGGDVQCSNVGSKAWEAKVYPVCHREDLYGTVVKT